MLFQGVTHPRPGGRPGAAGRAGLSCCKTLQDVARRCTRTGRPARMPKYDFRCSSCDAIFEAVRSFAQGTEDVVCPGDGAPATRLFSPPLDMIVYGGKSSTP